MSRRDQRLPPYFFTREIVDGNKVLVANGRRKNDMKPLRCGRFSFSRHGGNSNHVRRVGYYEPVATLVKIILYHVLPASAIPSITLANVRTKPMQVRDLTGDLWQPAIASAEFLYMFFYPRNHHRYLWMLQVINLLI